MKNIEMKQQIFGVIFLVSNKLQTIGDSILDELTLKQWFLLIFVSNMEKDNPSVSEIAEFIGSTRQNVRKMITALESKGYVSTKVRKDDRRNLEVTLTSLTFDFFKKFEERGNNFLEELFTGIPETDLSITNKVLQTLLNNILKMEANIEAFK